MTQATITTSLSLDEISPLPGKIESLKEQRAQKVASYQSSCNELEESFAGGNLDQASELCERADGMEREVDTLSAEIMQGEAELNGLIVEKLTDGRMLFKRLGNHNGGRQQVKSAAEYLVKAKEAHEVKNLTAALLQAHQAIALLDELAREHISSRISYHRNRIATF